MSYPSATTRPPGSGPIGCTARPVRFDQARPSAHDHSLPALGVATGAGRPGLAVNSLTRCRHTASIRATSAAATTGAPPGTGHRPTPRSLAYGQAAKFCPMGGANHDRSHP